MSLARAGRLCLQATSRNSFLLRRAEDGSCGAMRSFQQIRQMSGGHHAPGVTHAGLTLHRPAMWHKVLAEAFTGTMWFWIFVRAYHDGETLLYGHAPHFEHEAHGEDSAHKEH